MVFQLQQTIQNVPQRRLFVVRFDHRLVKRRDRLKRLFDHLYDFGTTLQHFVARSFGFSEKSVVGVLQVHHELLFV